MPTLIFRPTSTVTAIAGYGYGSANGQAMPTTQHGALGDNNRWTYLTKGAAVDTAASLGIYGLADPAVPAGSVINSVRSSITAVSSGAAGAPYSQMWLTGVGASDVALGDSNVVGDANPQFSNWNTTKPGGGAWTITDLNNLQIKITTPYMWAGDYTDIAEAYIEVDYTPPTPPAPTAVTPAAASTVTVPNPVLAATLTAAVGGQTQRAEWQFATDVGFTANVKVVTESTLDLRVSGATTETLTVAALNLSPNGSWYVRARGLDVYGNYGAYSASQAFTVTVPAPPVPTVITPAGGATVTVMTPTLGGTLGAASGGRLSHMEWQVATDAAFTANVRTITEATGDDRVSGATTEVVPFASKLTINGTWYMRARSIANDLSVSAWTANQTFTLALTPPPVPTLITPADLSTITTNIPVLAATLGAAAEGRTSRAEWQFATDAGFTANVRTITEEYGDNRVSGATTELFTAAALSQTLWYMRARSVDLYDYKSAYTATQSFTVAHQPNTTAQSPTGAVTLIYGATNTFSWTFTDPSSVDSQRAYQIIIERNDTGALVHDTGKIISASAARAIAVGAASKDLVLRWKIQVWDQDDVASVFSPYQLFTLTDPPTVTIGYPADGGTVDSSRPNFTWANDVATIQAKYQVVVKVGAVTVHDTGLIVGTALEYRPPVSILSNGSVYTVAITVTDNVGLTGTDTNGFTATYVAPANVIYTVNANLYPTDGYVSIDWSQTPADVYFSKWRVYRKELNENAWTIVLETADVNRVSYKDWNALSGLSYQYAVTQVGDRSGVLLESSIDPLATLYPLISSSYWLLNPYDDTKNFLLYSVTADSYTKEIEQESFIIIDRGRKTNYGTSLGKSGSLTAQLRDRLAITARQQRINIEAMQDARVTYLLRDPFGTILQVSMGSIQVDRLAGVGNSEFCDVTIPYSEVI